ncbi:hypothetical protein EJ110_NYTH17265 [Nymphaea thermarum]|nr:hypothetical protein EJ110_NYTH17265 [Nymphaea thermarum]
MEEVLKNIKDKSSTTLKTLALPINLVKSFYMWWMCHHLTIYSSNGPWIYAANVVPSTLHQCIKWSPRGTIATVLAENPKEKLPQPLVPHPTCTIEMPSVQLPNKVYVKDNFHCLGMNEPETMEQVNLVEWKGPTIYKLRDFNEAAIRDHPLHGHFVALLKGLHLMTKIGYKPYTGLGANEDGFIEPVSNGVRQEMQDSVARETKQRKDQGAM